nr:MAG TPA: hypothetical protein [Caudoviricetes sp.]
MLFLIINQFREEFRVSDRGLSHLHLFTVDKIIQSLYNSTVAHSTIYCVEYMFLYIILYFCIDLLIF